MTFRIRPPIIANPSICKSPRNPTEAPPVKGLIAARVVVPLISYPFRESPEPTTKTPSIRSIGLTSVSIGIVNPFWPLVTCPLTASSGGTGKKSTATGASGSSVIATSVTQNGQLSSSSERTVAPSLDAFLNVVRKDGGTIEKVDIWGKRRLAYEIAKHAEGIYVVVDLKAEPATVSELDRQLSLNESVLRTKVMRTDKH